MRNVQKSKMIYVNGDNWMGLYWEGNLIYQAHSIAPFRLMEYMFRHTPAHVSYLDADPDWLSERGGLPENFKDVIAEH